MSIPKCPYQDVNLSSGTTVDRKGTDHEPEPHFVVLITRNMPQVPEGGALTSGVYDLLTTGTS